MNKEMWKDIEGYEGIYQVSTLGRVRSLARTDARGARRQGKIMKQFKETNGYMRIMLCKQSEKKRFRTHRLVAQAFISNELLKPEVNHIDENKSNNTINNLEWVTNKENIRHGTGIERRARALYKPVTATHKETGEIIRFKSIKEAGESGFDRRNIDSCLRGRLNHHKSYSWKYE